MKKISLLLLVITMSLYSLNSQVLYQENFDTCTVNKKVAQDLGSTWWSTWSNLPGSTEDGVISSTQSSSPSNSAFISGDNDQIFKCGNKTTGRYQLSWKMFVPTGNCGYFNMLHVFAGANSQWSFESYVYNDTLSLNDYTTDFTLNAWHEIKFIIDIDDDFATCFIDGTEFVSFPWADGTYNGLDAIDFFAGSYNSQTPAYYIDDIDYEQVLAPDVPLNLSALVNPDNIDLTWNAPATSPTSYVITRNNKIIANTVDSLYTDIQPWPNDYNYYVRAFYGDVQGYSHNSNLATATITGGVSRDLVLFEGGTGTWCQYCPGAAMGLRDLIENNHKNAIAVEYHYGDSYQNNDAISRLNYYKITSFPTMVVGGILKVEGGSHTVSSYPSYLPLYEERIVTPALQNITVDVTNPTVDNFTASISVEEVYPNVKTGFTLHVALVQSNILESWQGQTECDFVLRKMYPNANGTTLNFTDSLAQNVTIDFNTIGFVKDNCQLVVFVQFDSTKEVTQATVVDLSTIPLSISTTNDKNFSIYPNPATDFINLGSNGQGTVKITDITGKVVLNAEVTQNQQNFNIANLGKGVYLVVYTSNQKTFTQKLIVK